MPSRAAAVTSSAPSGVAMTSPASTFSWFSGKPASSSSSVMPPGGVASAPGPISEGPASAGGRTGGVVAAVVGAGPGTVGRRKQLQWTLFKYGQSPLRQFCH
ncbi:hypothetical protein GUJ93_ZPchr0007g6236 [Zizania palustris]|uniref:Uncharacterized protein n=1 Tax=Zizania palustris TaxID=103762 RepID=A0A8J5SVG7_ZIZPA|nr:hypothetical protein GUJ93_ZPchr0007g6236 [Zizania palustris]